MTATAAIHLVWVAAHLGHWYIGLPVYVGPIVLIVLAIKVSEWRERRRRRGSPDGPSSREPR
jgi:hypothetical protein